VSVLDLSELLQTQRELQHKMGDPIGHGEAGCKENLLHAIVELVEAMREINFKPWKARQKPVDRKAFATEMTDVLQFWANAANAMELTPEELTHALRKKWVVNVQRIQLGEVKARCEHDWVRTGNWLIDRCAKCGEERA